jgi:SAM-dependent methyltransferase
MSTTQVVYDDGFYQAQSDNSYRSAGCVVPIVLSLVPVRSVVDVGCGVGTWAAKFLERGIQDVLGIDGDYVNRSLLRIPESKFRPVDLSSPFDLGRRFDLAVSLEVAEHLPPERAESFVRDLTLLAPLVLFSAAIPGQGGTDHINERYLSYWVELFARRDYVLLDVLRPRIWLIQECDWVYRQNVVMFAHAASAEAATLKVISGIDYVHPYLYSLICSKLNQPTLGYLTRSIPGSFRRSLTSRVGKLLRRR